ncbi:tetraspanin-15-like [Ornithodoros turicata]|uniref:tetraspanin-15-like n=1 Tax=Ornithodoros turicata TaxID=34597 RepID=UPI00313894E5
MLSSAALKRLTAATGIVLLCCGVVLIAVGSFVHARLNPFGEFYAGRLGPAIILIVMGVISFPLVALLSWAILREHLLALLLFLLILAGIIACEIGAAVAIFEYRFVIWMTVRERVLYDLNECRGFGLQYVQERLYCCGGPLGINDYRDRGLPVPSTCCPSGICPPCDLRLEMHYRYFIEHVGATAIVMLCLQFLSLLSGCLLAFVVRAENALIYTVNE